MMLPEPTNRRRRFQRFFDGPDTGTKANGWGIETLQNPNDV
jgi:hypothetical protein